MGFLVLKHHLQAQQDYFAFELIASELGMGLTERKPGMKLA